MSEERVNFSVFSLLKKSYVVWILPKSRDRFLQKDFKTLTQYTQDLKKHFAELFYTWELILSEIWSVYYIAGPQKGNLAELIKQDFCILLYKDFFVLSFTLHKS